MQEFGKYRLVARIGAGGMAEVFLAKSFGAEGLEKQVVIKRIRPENAQNPRFVSMFIDEAKIAVSLNHPNVVQVYEFGRVERDFYLAMEFVEGTDLAKLQGAADSLGKPFPVADAIYIGIEIAKALDYAHRKQDDFGRPLGIVHRDVSPQNILLSRDGGVKLLDFGIAKAAGAGVGDNESEIKGKFSYMSPEQARGDTVDGRSDIFSLGIVLWETLAGQQLFPYTSGKETLKLVKNAILPDIQSIRPDIGDDLRAILEKILAKEASERFETARDLQVALTRSLFSTGTIADSVTMAQYVSEVSDALENEVSRLPSGIDPHTPSQHGSTRPPMAPHTGGGDTSERLLDQLVEGTGLSSHVTELPEIGTGGTSITHPDDGLDSGARPALSTKVSQSERKEMVLVCGDLRGFANLRGNAHYERWQQVLMDYVRIVEAIAFKNNAIVDRLGEQGFTLALGLPISSENDAARAIGLSKALIEAVEAMNINLEAPLQLSVGVVVGSAVLEYEITPGATRSGKHQFEWNYDDEESGRGGLYLAESLARAAMSREILIGGRILRRIHRHYGTEPIQQVEVSLSEGDVELAAHRLLGPKSTRDQVREVRQGYHKLVGRDLALKNLRETYRKVLLDKKVRAIFITGEQGVGKSTLVNEFLTGLLDGRVGQVNVIRGVAELHDKDTAYGSLTSLLLELLRIPRASDLRRARQRLESLPEKLLTTLPEIDQRFVVHALAFLLGIKIRGNVVESLEPAGRKEALVRSLQLFMEAMASQRPMLLAIEDMQNIDTSTLSFLKDILARRMEAPICLVMTSLPVDDEDDVWRGLLSSDNLKKEILGELDPQGARTLSEALLPEGLAESSDLVDAIVARAGGNPLYIKELVELISARDLGDPREVVLQLGATDEESIWIPTTVEGLVTSRIDRLAPEVRKTLQRCGLFGPTFNEKLVRAVLAEGSDLDLETVMSNLDLLVEGDFLSRVEKKSQPASARDTLTLRRRRQDRLNVDAPAGLATTGDSTKVWAFPNSVIMEVSARGMVEPERSWMHQSIADFMLEGSDDLFQIDVVVIAYHLDAAGQHEHAGELYLVAAHQSVTSVGGDECLRLVNKALERIEPFTDHHREALELKERALALLGKPDERRELLEVLLEMADSERRRLRAWGRLLRFKFERGEVEEVERMSNELLTEARAADEQRAIGSALRLLHMVYRDTGRHEEALERIDEAIGCFQAIGDTEGLWAALVSKGITLRQVGRLGGALEAYKKALSIIEGGNYKRQEQTTLTNMGLLYANLGEYDKAKANYEMALNSIRALGYVRDEAALLANLGHLTMLYGEYTRAHKTLVEAVRLARRTRDKLALTDALLTLGVVHLGRGRLREGEALLQKGLRLARDISNIYLTSHGMMAMARMKLQVGTREAAAEALTFAAEASHIGSTSRLSWASAISASLTAEAFFKLGDPQTALMRSREAIAQIGEEPFEGAEAVLARHARIARVTDPESSEDARQRARKIVQDIAERIEDDPIRLRYLQSRHVREVLES